MSALDKRENTANMYRGSRLASALGMDNVDCTALNANGGREIDAN